MSFLVPPQHSQFCPQGLCESSPFLLQFCSEFCFSIRFDYIKNNNNNNNNNKTLLRNKIQILHVYGKNSEIL